MPEQTLPPNRFFWLKWILSSLIGVLVGLPLGIYVGWALGVTAAWVVGRGHQTEVAKLLLIPFLAIGSGLLGALGGALQAWLMRPRIWRPRVWIIANGLSWMVGLTLGGVVVFGLINGGYGRLLPMVAIINGGMIGLIVGIAQWGVLRETVEGAAWWILASLVAWAGGCGLGVATLRLLQVGQGLLGLLITTVAVFGQVLMVALFFLLQEPIMVAFTDIIDQQDHQIDRQTEGG